MNFGTLSHKKTLKHLQDKYAVGNLQPNALDESGLSLVHQLAYDGQTTCLKWLLKHGGDASVRSSEGCGAAHYAAAAGHLSILHLLQEEKHGSIDIKDNNGTYPLYIAAQEGQLDSVIWLTKHSGLSGSEPANDGMTALHSAAQEGHLDCVRYLIQLAHCSPVLTDFSGCSPLHFASAEGHWRVVKWLIEYGGARGDQCDDTGSTAVHLAAEYGKIKVLKILAKLNVPTTLTDKNGRTAIDICEEKGNTECLDFLREWQKQTSSLKISNRKRESLKKVRFDENNQANDTEMENNNTKIEQDYLVVAGQLSDDCLQEQLQKNKQEWIKDKLTNFEAEETTPSNVGREKKVFSTGRNVRKRRSFKDKNVKYQVKERKTNRDSIGMLLGRLQGRLHHGSSLPFKSVDMYPDLIKGVMTADRNASEGFRRRPSLEFFKDLRSQLGASNENKSHSTQNPAQSGPVKMYQNGALKASRENLDQLSPINRQTDKAVRNIPNKNFEKLTDEGSEENELISSFQQNETNGHQGQSGEKIDMNGENVKPIIMDKSKRGTRSKILSQSEAGQEFDSLDGRAKETSHSQKVKQPKGFMGILPRKKTQSPKTETPVDKPLSMGGKDKKSANMLSKNKRNYSYKRDKFTQHDKTELPPGTTEHYLIRSLPLPSYHSNRDGGSEQISFYSYNMSDRKQFSKRWMSVRQSVGSFFSSLRTKRRDKAYEVSDMLGSDGSYLNRQESSKFSITKSFPMKKRKSVSLEHMPNFSSSGEQIKITNSATGKSTIKTLTSLQPGYTEPDIYRVTAMALDPTLKGKVSSSPLATEQKPKPKPEESLDYIVANKHQTGFELDALQVNNTEDNAETGNALIW